jgi:methionyl-tRNA formyltransferase
VRVAFFGSGSPLSAIVLGRVAKHHDVDTVVIPDQSLGRRDRLLWLFGRRPDNPLTRAARELGMPVLTYVRNEPERLSRELTARAPELITVASFPSRLPADVLRAAKRGGVNLHQSLLPRGRGPDPIFWSYYNDERETGSTVHWLDEAFDHGHIISQRPVPIARGRPSTELYFDLADIGAQQLVEAIDDIARGEDLSTLQDEAKATYEGSPLKVPWRVPFNTWGAERTWHFLAGVGAVMGPLCRDPLGELLPMGAATSYTVEAHGHAPGSHEKTSQGLRLYCPDGVVEVTRSPAPR